MENNFGLILLDLVRTNKDKFLGLLRRNGVLVNTNISNENLTNMILKAMQKSESFKKETILLMGVLMGSSDDAFANFTPSNPFGGLPSFDPNIFSPKDTKSTTTKTDKPKKDFADTTVGGIFDKLMTGFNSYTNLKLAEAEKAKAGSAKSISDNELELELEKLGNKGGKNKDDEEKGNVGLYIGLGVGGLALVGTLVYLISKKK